MHRVLGGERFNNARKKYEEETYFLINRKI